MKVRIRTALSGIAALGAIGALAACGTTGSQDGGAPTGEGKDGPYQIATVPKVDGISWFEAMANGVEQFDEDLGDEVDAWQIGPDTEDAAKQVQIIEDLIAQNVDAMVVVPNDPQALEPALTKARERGIVVITHEAPALAGTEAVDYDLEAFDNAVFGERMFEKLAEGMGGEGTFVGMVGSLTSETHMAWYNAGIAYLEENYPEITPVTAQPYEDNNDDATARANALEILRAYPDLDGFVNGSVSAGANFSAVLKEKNNTHVTVSSLSLPSVAGPYLEEGWTYSAQTWNPAGAGYAGNVLALKLLQGETIESGIDLGFEGYESVTVDGEMVVGDAIMMLEKGQFPDGYPF
ncbi:substrate-binding domain-containing protein [Pseudactinotalea sp. HY158]|uniref:substrate-binding domain-containing protein n=1 Tax=Pseudactinotalea sp. HY158 TaxID=2654547 RepID=UPI00129D1EA8|nr:substrate-binding domain-containing protein [Pseudactinotalea sp. HY158]QGH68153.1 substrate-binding domain-containing protein [Pseudactinotalea sp. HY158]